MQIWEPKWEGLTQAHVVRGSDGSIRIAALVLLIMSEDRNAKYRAKYEEQWHNFSTLKRERSCVGNKGIVGSDGDVTRTSGLTPVPH